MGLLDGAASCMVAYAYETGCLPADVEERICRIVCCCNLFPIVKKYRLKQLCVDRLMAAYNTAEDGILPGVPFDMKTLEVAQGYPKATIAAQLKKYLDGDYFTNRIRIPDVTVLKDPKGPINASNIDKIYEIKFPKDRDRPGQIKAYEKIAGGPKNRVKKIDVAKGDCNCNGRTHPDDIPVPDEVKQAAIEYVNNSMLRYIEENETELLKALGEAGMAVEAQSISLAYLRGTDPNFFLKILGITIAPGLAKQVIGLGKTTVPGTSPFPGTVPVTP